MNAKASLLIDLIKIKNLLYDDLFSLLSVLLLCGGEKTGTPKISAISS